MNSKTDIVVVKRDFERQVFSFDKLITSILKSGVPSEDAERISRKIEDWVINNAKNGEINSTLIRDKVTEELSEGFEEQADSYQAFVKG